MSTGDVHEGLNLAAVLQVPAVFVLQNNGYAYSTPIERQMANTNMAERVRDGWGIPSERVDGTDALAVYASVLGAIERARAGEGPQAVEALTLRMHGHAAHDDGRYMDKERLQTFADRFDPVERLAARLRLDGLRIDEIDRCDRPRSTRSHAVWPRPRPLRRRIPRRSRTASTQCHQKEPDA